MAGKIIDAGKGNHLQHSADAGVERVIPGIHVQIDERDCVAARTFCLIVYLKPNFRLVRGQTRGVIHSLPDADFSRSVGGFAPIPYIGPCPFPDKSTHPPPPPPPSPSPVTPNFEIPGSASASRLVN